MRRNDSTIKDREYGSNHDRGARITQRPRQENDFYSTPEEATEALLRRWKPTGNVWEPCAGISAIADVVQRHKPDDFIYQSDINPQRDNIVKQDFLKTTELPHNIDTIITNPPFKYAEAFIRHGFALGVKRQAMLLKSTFFHAKSRFELFHDMRPKLLLPMNWRLDFMNLGRPTMETMWVIWEDIANTKTTEYDILEKPLSAPEIEALKKREANRHKRLTREALREARLA